MSRLFDDKLRAARRDRAQRMGPELFLLDRAFEDCLERVSLIRRRFQSALLLGCPNPDWAARLGRLSHCVHVFDPGARFAEQSGGLQSDENALPVAPNAYDLIVAIGTLDTAEPLPDALLRLRLALRPDGLLLGAVSGGETLPQLRSALRAADAVAGAAVPHVHPRLVPSALIGLLEAAGFIMPVVDVDRVTASYGSLRALVRDLRAMGATNILVERPSRSISKLGLAAAERAFRAAGQGGRTQETFEIIHFAGWTPNPSPPLAHPH